MKEQFLEEVIVCLDDDFGLPSHGRSTSFEDHLIIDLESPLVLREHSAWWLLLDAFQDVFDVGDLTRLLDGRPYEALELMSIDNWLDLRELEVELFDEVASLNDEADVFVAQDFLGGQARDVYAWPVGSDYLAEEVKLIVAAIALEVPFLVLAHHFIDDISAV